MANCERPVLGCIDAKFCKSIFVWKLFTRSTRFTLLRLLEKRTEVYTLLRHSKRKLVHFEVTFAFFNSQNFGDFSPKDDTLGELMSIR